MIKSTLRFFLSIFGKNVKFCLALLIINHASVLPAQLSVPTIVHVISEEGRDETTDIIAIGSALERINLFFGGAPLCAGEGTVPVSRIQLCGATRNNTGEASSGISFYHGTGLGNLDACTEELNLKLLPARGILSNHPYPPSDYLNIFVVDDICNSCAPANCLAGGFSTLANAHGAILDGIVVERSTLNGDQCDDLKALLHELGHYFNLLHTFEGSGCDESDCLTEGDLVCDTPQDNTADIFSSNSCLEGIGNTNGCNDELIDNLMDYAPLGCMRAFTAGQINRMESAIEGDRVSLLSSMGCAEPCAAQISASINFSTLNWEPDVLFSPVNLSTGGNGYEWFADGEMVSNAEEPSISFSAAGQHLVEVTVFGDGADCDKRLSWVVIVACSVSLPRIISEGHRVVSGAEVSFTLDEGSPTANWQWLVDGVPAGNSLPFTYQFNGEGTRYVEVEVDSGTCRARSGAYAITVGVCETGLEASRWVNGWSEDFEMYFGDGALQLISFPERSPIIECPMVINDSLGNLVFYSNGDEIFDADHQELYDNLEGNPSAYQQIALRRPGFTNKYDLFFPGGVSFFSPNAVQDAEFFHSSIDYNPVTRNLLVASDGDTLHTSSPERVTAIRHCNGIDWWVIGQQFNTSRFNAYLLTSGGVNTTAVVSEIGDTLAPNADTFGTMRGSPSNRLIATCTQFDLVDLSSEYGRVELFRFSNETGLVTDVKKLADSLFRVNAVEFSLDEAFLYVVGSIPGQQQRVYQIELEGIWDKPDAVSTEYMYDLMQDSLMRTLGTPGGNLKMAPDGKMYGARPNSMYQLVIEKPTLAGDACDLQLRGVDLTAIDRRSALSFPEFPADAYAPNSPVLEGPRSVNLCTGTTGLTYGTQERCFYQAYEWELLSASGSLLQSTVDSAVVLPRGVGIDTLIVKTSTACLLLTDTIFIDVEDCNSMELFSSLDFSWLFADTMTCAGEPVQLQYSTNADRVELVREDGTFVQHLQGSFHDIVVGPGHYQYGLRMTSETRAPFDTIVYFTGVVADSLVIDWISLPMVVCEGDIAFLDLTTEADLINLFNNGEVKTERVNPTFPLELGPFDQDSCFQLRFRQDDRSCERWVEFCVEVASPPITTNSSYFDCIGSMLELSDTTLVDTGFHLLRYELANGCDSLHEVRFSYYSGIDTMVLSQTGCIATTQDTMIYNSMVNGCDSVVIIQTIVDLNLKDTTVLTLLSCDVAIPDTVYLTNLKGCDSLVITNYILDPGTQDTTFLQVTNCVVNDPDTLRLANMNGCDSLVITTTVFDPNMRDTSRFVLTSCLANGSDTLRFTNIAGCDSLVVTEFQFDPALADTVYVETTNCFFASQDTIRLENGLGCDSLVVVTTLLGTGSQDTTNIQVYDCVASSPDTLRLVNINGCDSLVITTTLLALDLRDTFRIVVASCFPSSSDTLRLINSSGCDSLVITNILFDPGLRDTTIIEMVGCETTETDTIRLTSSSGCDSLVIVNLQFDPLLRDTIYLERTDCAVSGQDTIRLENSVGCDSVIIWTTVLLQSDTTYNFSQDCGLVSSIEDTARFVRSNGCDSLVITRIDPVPVVASEIRASYEITLGDSLRLANPIPPNGRLRWEPAMFFDCDSCEIVTAYPTQPTMIRLLIIDSLGCITEASSQVVVKAGNRVYIPSAFSPNNDGVNDFFEVYVSPRLRVQRISLTVYNRWGAEVYQEVGFDLQGWDGTIRGESLASSGVYLYRCDLQLEGGEEITLGGEVVLVR